MKEIYNSELKETYNHDYDYINDHKIDSIMKKILDKQSIDIICLTNITCDSDQDMCYKIIKTLNFCIFPNLLSFRERVIGT